MGYSQVNSKSKDLILLLQPPVTIKQDDIATFGIFPPIGLLYIASALEKEGYDVEIVDMLAEAVDNKKLLPGGKIRVGMSKDQIISLLSPKKPSVIGISNNFTTFSHDAIILAKTVRETLPDALIVMGGAHASMEYESILRTGYVDCVVIGEGEETFVELIKGFKDRNIKEAKSIKGTVWFENGHILKNNFREPVQNLDELPIPAYHLLPMDKYIWQRQANFAYAMRYPIGHMITTRGCINNCIFCSTTKHFKRFRKRSVDNVLAEMKLLIDNYGIREFHFHDDSFMSDIEHVRMFCNRLLDEKMDIKWQVSQGINSNRLDRDLLKLMRDSGMYRVGFPIESGSVDMLKYIRKPINLDKVKSLINVCNELGIYCFGCFMIGFPEETKEQIEETISFIMQTSLDYIKVSITQPLAGSVLYNEYKKLGLLNKSSTSSTYFHTEFDTLHLKAEELNKIRQDLVRSYSRKRIKRVLSIRGFKKYILPKLQSFEDINYFLKVAWMAIRGI